MRPAPLRACEPDGEKVNPILQWSFTSLLAVAFRFADFLPRALAFLLAYQPHPGNFPGPSSPAALAVGGKWVLTIACSNGFPSPYLCNTALSPFRALFDDGRPPSVCYSTVGLTTDLGFTIWDITIFLAGCQGWMP